MTGGSASSSAGYLAVSIEGFNMPGRSRVVNPSISAGARLSARYRPGQDIEGHIRRIHAKGAAAMVQPYMRSIDTDWEAGTYVFGGDVSHAIRKGPVLESEEGPVDDMSKALLQPVKPLTVDPQLADLMSV